MAEYYIDTAAGPRGPYPESQIIDGVRNGRIPTGARIRNAVTNETCRAVDLTDTRPADSSPHEFTQPAPHPAPASQPYRAPQYPPQQQAYPQHGQPYPQYGQPYPQQASFQPYGHQSYAPYPVAPQTSGLAIAALVISAASPLVCTLLSIGGIICGIIALKECEPHGTKKGRGLALAGIWVGVGLLVLTAALFAFIFSLPHL
jgi:hypothetical protein